MNQHELEQEMIDGGRNRAAKMFKNNEEAGNATANPYASALFRRFVLPLAQVIEHDLTAKLAGRRQAHVVLLGGMDAEAVAFIAVRSILNGLLGLQLAGRSIVQAVGKAVYSEYLLQQFDDINPALYHTIVNEFDRKLTKSERHRMTVFKMQAKQNGINFAEWGMAEQAQVGGYLVDTLEALGLIRTHSYTKKVGAGLRNELDILLSPDVQALIGNIKEHIELTTPEVMPCVEQPVDWTAIDEGGWHTPAMRRASPYCVRAKSHQREHMSAHDLTNEFTAINHLQGVRWQIHSRMLDTIRSVAAHFDMDEIVSQAEFPAPTKPGWLEVGMAKEDMSPELLAEFTNWKRETAEWHTQMKLRGTKWGRMYTALRVAEKFRHEPVIYFVYFADFRGRKYVQTTGVSPQGSDMQKALLRFADGYPIENAEQEEWFLINGANRFGVDKVSVEDRVQWVKDNHDFIISFAQDPIANNAWKSADSPFQFLAWCFEYADYKAFGPAFRTHLAVGMDGSCNGLQNFSAMLRDEVGGEATNLIPAKLPKDIYAMVADVTLRKLLCSKADDEGYRDLWIKHGINRTLVKRSVMTLPYGSTRFSCADFIVGDYLRMGKAPEFTKEQYGKAATFLSHFVWSSIGDVVVKARQAMDWLQSAAKLLIKEGETKITWITPSGFPAAQTYWETDIHRINTRLCGGTKLVIQRDSDLADTNRHRNGISPNFIHSMDASHLTLTVLAARHSSIDALAMIHDDYGTHATFAPQLSKIIREVFVGMYENSSPLEDLRKQYPQLPPPPAMGSLNLRDVLESRYFFA